MPSPCTLKARGTVVRLPNGQLSMNTSNARSPMYTWTLGIQHAFGASTSLTVNYVGTHTYDLASEININQATPGAAGGGLPAAALGTVDRTLCSNGNRISASFRGSTASSCMVRPGSPITTPCK